MTKWLLDFKRTSHSKTEPEEGQPHNGAWRREGETLKVFEVGVLEEEQRDDGSHSSAETVACYDNTILLTKYITHKKNLALAQGAN